MIVTQRWRFSSSDLQHYNGIDWNARFGFNGLGAAMFYRSYARQRRDGTQEDWFDCCVRVVEGTMTLLQWHAQQHGNTWDERAAKRCAHTMLSALLEMRWMPAGRGLWAMGTEHVYNVGSMALNNCGAVDVRRDNWIDAMCWAMDALMLGVGVGFGLYDTCLPPLHKPHQGPVDYVVQDSREGWVDSVRALLHSYIAEDNYELVFDYSHVRPAGEPIRGFGGVSAGPQPLINLHEQLRNVCNTACEGNLNATRFYADVANLIGVAVVSGNVRRGAEILIGSPQNATLRQLKNYERFPERAPYGWMSNNTVMLREHEDFLALPQLAAQLRERMFTKGAGEPGIANLVNIQHNGRVGESVEDNAYLLNPCQPSWATVLTPDGISTLNDVSVGSLIWTGQQFSRIARKQHTGTKDVYAYRTTAGTFHGTQQHRVISHGERVEAQNADAIDAPTGTYDITSIEYISTEAVYDITVEAPEHTYWTGGLLVSNCGEIPLEPHELCNVVEIIPTRCHTETQLYEAAECAVLYAQAVSLLPTHSNATNEVTSRNRRIGVSIAGAADWLDAQGDARVTRLLRDLYKHIVKRTAALAQHAGIPAPVRHTTIKPGGTVPLLAGVSPGMHYPAFAHAIRRANVPADSDLAYRLQQAGVPNEPSVYTEGSLVFEFPIRAAAARPQASVTAWEQFSLLAMLQREWADNAVSCTISFDPANEAHDLEHMLGRFAPLVKSVSLLPRVDEGAYDQMPYEGISAMEYEERCAAIRPIDWRAVNGDADDSAAYCDNDACVI